MLFLGFLDECNASVKLLATRTPPPLVRFATFLWQICSGMWVEWLPFSLKRYAKHASVCGRWLNLCLNPWSESGWAGGICGLSDSLSFCPPADAPENSSCALRDQWGWAPDCWPSQRWIASDVSWLIRPVIRVHMTRSSRGSSTHKSVCRKFISCGMSGLFNRISASTDFNQLCC